MRIAPRRRPSLEALEDRSLMTVYGLPWPDPQHLTVSFVPDGTSVGGTPSKLFGTMNSEMPAAQWQSDVAGALQSWADLGNINIGVVPDDGRPLGAPGPEQGVPGVGDIRIAAMPLSNNEVAIGSPYDTLGGWNGTIIFNSNASFGDTSTALENFLSVAVHEAGHVFGFADQNTDPSSALYDIDTGARTSPSTADATLLQSLYGARHVDPSSTFATASSLGFNAIQAVDADISTLSSVNTYKFTTPLFVNLFQPVAIDVRTAGVSLLTPKLTVYNVFGQVVATATSTNPLDNSVSITLPSSWPGMTYYAQVQSGQSGVFGMGSYRIAVGSSSQAQSATLASDPLSYAGGNGNDTLATATPLTPNTTGTDARWPYAVSAGLSSSADADYYRLQTGSSPPTATLVTVYNLQTSTLTPQVSVFGSNGAPLATQVLSSSSGGETVQILGLPANSSYYVEVSAPGSSSAASSYFLGATSRATPVGNPTLATGTVTASNPLDFRTLTVDATRVFHFDLSGSVAAGAPQTAILMTIFDASGHAVFSLREIAGTGLSTGEVVLGAGTYYVRMIAATKTGVALPPFTYVLGGQILDEADGPSPVDTTLNPVGSNPGGPPNDSGGWTTQAPSYYNQVLQPADIYGNPWM